MRAGLGGVGRCYEKGGVGMGSAPLPTQGPGGSRSSLANSFRVKSLPGSVTAISWSRTSSCETEDPVTAQVSVAAINWSRMSSCETNEPVTAQVSVTDISWSRTSSCETNEPVTAQVSVAAISWLRMSFCETKEPVTAQVTIHSLTGYCITDQFLAIYSLIHVKVN